MAKGCRNLSSCYLMAQWQTTMFLSHQQHPPFVFTFLGMFGLISCPSPQKWWQMQNGKFADPNSGLGSSFQASSLCLSHGFQLLAPQNPVPAAHIYHEVSSKVAGNPPKMHGLMGESPLHEGFSIAMSGWLFGTFGLLSQSVGNPTIPTILYIFQRGRYITNQVMNKHMPIL